MKPSRPLLGIASLIAILTASMCLTGGAYRSVFAQTAATRQSVRLTLLATTDIHGNIESYNYAGDVPDQGQGFAKIATLIHQVRQEQPNALLFDCGDMIQGTPVVYYAATHEPEKPNPMILAMNQMDYTAAALGNHEFDFGLKNLWKAKGEAHFPILAANVKQAYQTGTQHFDPYMIKTVDGVRVGIVGFVTQSIPHWERPENYQGYQFESIVDAAKRVIPEVRAKSDVVVALVHSGLGFDPDDHSPQIYINVPGEHQVLELANQVAGIDVIIFGHTHNEVAERFVNGVLLTQPKNWARALGRVDLDVSRGENGKWTVDRKHSTVIPVTPLVVADPEILKQAAPYIQDAKVYLDTPVATSAKDMRGTMSRFEDEPLTDLIHAVQLDYGHADVSMTTMLNSAAHIPAGPISIRQINTLYIYENYLCVVEMTGAQFRTALEHAASVYQPWPLPPGEKLRLPTYNVDTAAGVNYVIDLRKPAGHRVVELTYKGKPLDDKQKLRVATNNYRYGGGGGYDMFAGLPIVYQSTEEMRDLLIEYLTKRRTVPTAANQNWRIEPQEAVDALRQLAMHTGPETSRSIEKLFPADFARDVVPPPFPSVVALLAKSTHRIVAESGNPENLP